MGHLKFKRLRSWETEIETQREWAKDRSHIFISFLRKICQQAELCNHNALKQFLGFEEHNSISYTHHLDYSPTYYTQDYDKRELLRVDLPNKNMRAVFCYDADASNPQQHLPKAVDKSFFDKLVVTHYAGTASRRMKLFYHYETWLKCNDEHGETWLVNINFPCGIFQINVVKGDDPKFMTGNEMTTWPETYNDWIRGYVLKITPPTKEMLDGKWQPKSSDVKLNVWDILQEFSETRYSFLTPAIAGPGKNKNNCQSTHKRVVQMCLGSSSCPSKKDIAPHMIFRVCTKIKADNKAKGITNYGEVLEAILKKNQHSKTDSPTSGILAKPRRRRLSNQRLIDRFIRESERISRK